MKEEEKTRWRIRANTYAIMRSIYWVGGAILISLTSMTLFVSKFASFICLLMAVMCTYLMLKSNLHFKKRIEKIGEFDKIDVTWKEVLFPKRGDNESKEIMKKS